DPELLISNAEPLALSLKKSIQALRVGWIHITGITSQSEESTIQSLVTALNESIHRDFPSREYWQHIIAHTVLLDENNFYRLVETCLERRTCNRVDQDTGTVAQGALFSYEALPRASLLYSRIYAERFPENIKVGSASSLEVCELAREGFARMGIGGMQTRGLGSLLVEPLGREGSNG
ncbi:MAG: hypothetical protein D3923_03405, partial [Candidatus Electrothrix sp. AR3]|nr:hypothetical protein [Candidatus Electrothrix sp. AR3]